MYTHKISFVYICLLSEMCVFASNFRSPLIGLKVSWVRNLNH
jgi:hypothetical protein